MLSRVTSIIITHLHKRNPRKHITNVPNFIEPKSLILLKNIYFKQVLYHEK